MELTIANILTLSRLFLAPVFVASFIAGLKDFAFAVFCIAGFTDLIDGTVARLLGQLSKKGALLDPIADKLLMQGCFTALVITGYLPLWFYLIALLRDVMIVSGVFYLEHKKTELPYRSVWVSKVATLFQLVVAVLALLIWKNPETSAALSNWLLMTMCITATLICISAVQYVILGLGLLKKNESNKLS